MTKKKLFPKSFPQHGMRRSPEYSSWRSMIRRCEDPQERNFAHYGGRGISVCARWRHSFTAFLADMGLKPSPRHTIDRRDVNGHYVPENCRWATNIEQARNRTDSRWLEHGGQRLTVVEWAERIGVDESVIRMRLKRGWSVAEALSTARGNYARAHKHCTGSADCAHCNPKGRAA